ncbi:Adenine nucleotide alpha hydrolase-like superfamily protein, partial [Zea mays]
MLHLHICCTRCFFCL